MILQDQVLGFFSLGAQDSAAATAFLDGEAALLQNLRISPEGTAEIRSGSMRLHATAMNSGAQCYGFTKQPFITAAGVKQWVGFFGDSAYYSTDGWATQTLIATGLRTDYWSLATIRVGSTNYLLAANGGASGYSWTGAAWATLAGGFPAGVKEIEVFNGRVAYTGHNGPLVQLGRIASISEFTGRFSVSVQVQTHDGDADVVGLYQVGDLLLAFKRGSTAWINGFGQTDIVVAAGATGLSRSVGLLGRRSVQAAGDQGLLFQSDRGIEFYQPGAGIRLASTGLKNFFRTIALADLASNPGLSDAVFVPGLNEYHLATSAAGSKNDYVVRVHLDLPRPDGGFACSLDPYTGTTSGTLYVDANGSLTFSAAGDRQKLRTTAGSATLATGTQAGRYVEIDANGSLSEVVMNSTPAALFVADRSGNENLVPHSAGYDGYVRALDTGAKDDLLSDGTGGSALAGRLQSPPVLPRYLNHEKWVREVEAQIVAPSATTVTLAVVADGVTADSQSVAVAASTNSEPVSVKIRTSAKGKVCRAEVSGSLAGLKVASLTTRAEVRRRRF